MDKLQEYIAKKSKVKGSRRKRQMAHLYCDIETFTTNRQAKQKSEQQSYVFSLAISWWEDKRQKVPEVIVYNNFIEFFTKMAEVEGNTPIKLYFHNGKGYDNHFMEYELNHYMNVPIVSEYVKNADSNAKNHMKKKNKKDGNCIYEQRIRSGNKCDLTIFFAERWYTTKDTLDNTNEKLANCAKRLIERDLMDEKYAKTTFDYAKYDSDEPMNSATALQWSKRAFQSLTDSEITYIHNDVIILAYLCKYYSQCYNGFDLDKMTFTQNVKEMYMQENDLTSFQLTKQIDKYHLKYADYQLFGLNGFDYFRKFYKGGLNLYNEDYVGRIINRAGFSIDENSAYPTVMYKEKLPTYLIKHVEQSTRLTVDYTNKDIMTFFVMTIDNANNEILQHVKSRVIRNAIVKYYNPYKGHVYLNSALVELLNWLGFNVNTFTVEAYSIFETEYFGAREVLRSNYYIKQGCELAKHNQFYNVDYDNFDPTNIVPRERREGDRVFYPEEKQACKVPLNSIYGVPALRAKFNIFYRDEDGNIKNERDGFTNKERNIIFSAGVTAFAFRNLLGGMRGLSASEIDEYFLYCDTDSLYLLAEAEDKLDSNMFDKNNLGGWDVEHRFTKFYPFNHKKYALYEDGDIVVRCGGVAEPVVNMWIARSQGNFEYFVNHYFTSGVKIANTHSIRNKQNTISVYEATTELKQGDMYYSLYSHEAEEAREALIKAAIEFEKEHTAEGLYYESGNIVVGGNDLVKCEEPDEFYLTGQQLIEEFKQVKNILKKC